VSDRLLYSEQMTTKAASVTDTRSLPEGVVTFMFTDIQGSTQLLRRLGDAYAEVLSIHRHLLRRSFTSHRGREVDTQGDSFLVAFSSPREAVAAAADAQRALATYPWPHGEPVLVRMALHTGEPLLVEGHYIGIDVHRAARICSAAHGGQVVMSHRTRELVEGRTGAGLRFKDLGRHRLKDLERPESIQQLLIEGLPDTFPPLKSQRPPTNVPRHVGNLVGRHRELRELRELLLSAGVRLVTVIGPGGAGKTRVSAAAALEVVEEFLDGVFFVDLSTVGDAALVATEIARALQVPLDGEEPAEAALAQHIGDRRMLLVLDNFEQVLEGALVAARLLESCRHLKVLATSRLSLSIRAEQEYRLQPLELASDTSFHEAERSEAVQLFVERASQARRGFELTEDNARAVVEICALVDGLPLAIELAAARTKLFPPQTLLPRLDNRLGLLSGGAQDSPIRHRALRTTIDWSYDLLSPDERAFFRDLAVFSGSADYDAIEAVLAAGSHSLDLLTALVNHSLIRQHEDDNGDVRFRMLQTIRDYAVELLHRSPDHLLDLRERHAQHYLDVVESAKREGGAASLELPGMAQDQDNLRAALAFWLDERLGEDRDAGTKALRLASILGNYWYHHGQAIEGAGWLDRALSTAVDPPEEVRALALRMLGVLKEQRREFDRAIELFEQALSLYRDAEDRSGEAACLNSLGIAMRSGQREGAMELYQAAVAIRRELGDQAGLTTTLNNLGILYLDLGEVAKARSLFAENLVADRASNDDWGAACTLLNLSVAHLLDGDIETSREMVREALTSFIEIGDSDAQAEALETCLGIAVAQERWVVGVRIAGAADALREALGVPCAPADRIHLDGWLDACLLALDVKSFDAAWREGTTMTADQAMAYALSETAPE